MNRLTLIVLAPAAVLCQAVWWVRYLWLIVVNPTKALQLAVAVDQLANAALHGDMDRTISSRAAFAADRGERWACVLCKWLDRLDPGHCEKAKGV